ncbi:hypothetical protein MHB71_26100 [Paenibacillus sp. FSL H7-0940]|uniref:hypothetical protein n=1 Tax=Paenibacillus sp. FSL H7-0940 TaxID=2921443 RepID=UPI0030ED5FB7
MEVKGFKNLTEDYLNETNGGGWLDGVAESIGKAIPAMVEGTVKGFNSLVVTSWKAGNDFGNYLESQFKK